MIEYLSKVLDDFPGPANQTRCFAHTINLCAKAILRQFDMQKKKDVRAFNDVALALAALADEDRFDTEPVTSNGEEVVDKEENRHEDEDNKDVDDVEDEELAANLQPIWSMLMKVCLHFLSPHFLNPNRIAYQRQKKAAKTCVQPQELVDNPSSSLV
jgi:hypothetical protein